MKEVLLHHIWSSGLLFDINLRTIQGEKIRILSIGEHNKNAGPDFINASIELSGIKWVGNVEIHVKSSNWNEHNHSKDAAYRNIILHVVFESNIELEENYPTLELCQYFSKNEIERKAKEIVDAKNQFHFNELLQKSRSISSDKIEELVVKRLERKSEQALIFLKEIKNDWQYLFFIMLCRNMGFQVNSLAFEMMARSLPLTVLLRYINSLTNLEALLFGQASLIPYGSNSNYANRLYNQHRIYAIKYRLHAVNRSAWKFSRTRPRNFPSVRMAQLAAVVFNCPDMIYNPVEFSKTAHASVFAKIQPSLYWLSHYDFEKRTKTSDMFLGKTTVENIIINTIVPYLYLFEKNHGIKSFRANAFDRLDGIAYEKNIVTKMWLDYDIKGTTALESQAFIELNVNSEN